MPNPKRRHSKSRTSKRRTHDALKPMAMSECPQCHELKLPHAEVVIEAMPSLLLPRKGRFGLIDYEKMFCPDLRSGHDIYSMRGIDRDEGCMVVVRPDQYVAHVLPLNGHEALATYFGGFMHRVGLA